MTRYSVHIKDRIFVKGYGFLSFARNTGKNLKVVSAPFLFICF